MARQNINIGSSANDGTGDPLRTAFDKINDNFIELYGTDGDSNTLAGNLDINGWNIISSRSNEDIRILPAGTGGVIASAVRIAGTTISSDDSTQITLAENVQTTGTLNVSGAATIGGAATLSTSLTLASGATVTSILDEDAMGSDSATALATQQSIKAYVDSQVTAQDLDFACDDSTALSIDLDSEALQFSGGNGITTAGTDNTVTISVDTGTVVTLTDSQTLTNKVLTSPTISSPTITGVTTTTSLTTNDITSNGSNANITIDPQGTGTIELGATTNISGSASVSGTLSTADITTTGNQTISGSLTTGTFNVGDLNINADGKISTDTNGNIDLDPSGTGAINLTGPTNVTGTATVTGQLNVDNLSMDANTISSTSGGVTITAPAGQDVAIGGTGVKLTATEANFTLAEITTLRADTIQNDTSDGDISISTQGTGVIDLNTATQSTVGSAGGANALPATPTGYIKIKIAGTMRVIPFYDEA
jgi:hypothetical protein